MTTETAVRRANDRPAQPLIAIVLAVGLLIVAAFQGALALGAPLGAAAMGGTNARSLPGELRLVTGPAALVGLLGLGALMNFASPSPWERWGWGQFTLIMFGLCLVLAKSGSPAHPVPRE